MGRYFEAKVAEDMGELKFRFNPDQDGFWVARSQSKIIGRIPIDSKEAATTGARLRYFILASGYQGQGVGKRLQEPAIDFCKSKGYSRVYLSTFAGLDAARVL